MYHTASIIVYKLTRDSNMSRQNEFSKRFGKIAIDAKNPFEPGTRIFDEAQRKLTNVDKKQQANPFEPGTEIFQQAEEIINSPSR